MYSTLLILYREAFETLMTRITMVTCALDSRIWPVCKLSYDCDGCEFGWPCCDSFVDILFGEEDHHFFCY